MLGGKYRVLRKLGAGGMGEVLLARHTELDQDVAIKVMTAEVGDDSVALERFMREARAVARIASEHVVRVFDVGRFDDGRPYIVMEYLEGEDLSTRLERGPLSVPEAVGWVLQACVAIAEAHRVGVIHRDLKPGNLFITRKRDGTDVLKVVDFGISKAVSRDGRAEAALTQTGHLVGSPFYMSPEQLRGAELDGRTDVWSLGVILFELVTGEGPFEAPTLPEMCVGILSTPALKLTEARPDLHFPAGFEDVVDLCLAKDPKARFSDTVDLALALGSYAEGSHVSEGNMPTKAPESRARGARVEAEPATREVPAAAPGPAGRVPVPKRMAREPRRSRAWLAAVGAAVLVVVLLIVAMVRMNGTEVKAAASTPTESAPVTTAPPPSSLPVVSSGVASAVASATPPSSSPSAASLPRPVAPKRGGNDEFGGRK